MSTEKVQEFLKENENFIRSGWAPLELYFSELVKRVITSGASSAKFIATADDLRAYAAAYNLCVSVNTKSRSLLLRGHCALPVGDTVLYNKLVDIFSTFLKKWQVVLSDESLTEPHDIVAQIERMWGQFVRVKAGVCFAFRYLDQYFTKNPAALAAQEASATVRQVAPIATLCNQLLEEVVYLPTQERLHTAITSVVMGVRGQPVDVVLQSCQSLSASIKLVHLMDDYEASLEKSYLAALESNCNELEKQWREEDMGLYLVNTERLQEEECAIIKNCFGIESTLEKALSSIRKVLLEQRRKAVFTDAKCGIPAAIKGLTSLARIYKLYSYDGASVAALCDEVRSVIAGDLMSREVMSRHATDNVRLVTYVRTTVKDLEGMLRVACDNNPIVMASVALGFREAIGTTVGSIFDGAVVSVLDTTLRKPEALPDLPCTDVAYLARFCTNPKTLRTMYGTSLVQRYLLRVPSRTVVEREMSVVSDLRLAFGPALTRRVQALVYDVAQKQRTLPPAEGRAYAATYRVLNGHMWAGAGLSSDARRGAGYVPPEPVKQVTETLTEQLAEEGKTLVWAPQLGMSEVTMALKKSSSSVTLVCSNVQLSALLALEAAGEESGGLRPEDIIATSGLKAETWRTVLRTLVQVNLVSETDGGRYVLDTAWDPKVAKVVLPQPGTMSLV
eukprot:PhM_4_TR1055/c0_g1_i1/m.331/K03347/CUL1, CDC53; cullin 1